MFSLFMVAMVSKQKGRIFVEKGEIIDQITPFQISSNRYNEMRGVTLSNKG